MERIVPGYSISNILFAVKYKKDIDPMLISNQFYKHKEELLLKGELEKRKAQEQHLMMGTSKKREVAQLKKEISTNNKFVRVKKINTPFETAKKATDVLRNQVDEIFDKSQKANSEQFQKDLSVFFTSPKSYISDSTTNSSLKKVLSQNRGRGGEVSDNIFASPLSRGSSYYSSSSDDVFFNTFNPVGNTQTLLELEFVRDKDNLVAHAINEGMPSNFIDMLKSIDFLNSDIILEIEREIEDYKLRKNIAKNKLQTLESTIIEEQNYEDDDDNYLHKTQMQNAVRKTATVNNVKKSLPHSLPVDDDNVILHKLSNPLIRINTGQLKGFVYGVYKYTFELEKMPGDGDCGFHALEFNRDQLISVLIQKQGDLNARKKLHDEIKEEMSVNGTRTYHKLINDEDNVNEKWRMFLQKIGNLYSLEDTVEKEEGDYAKFLVD